ncbi:MAG: toprim domain-containing protein, partial [Deltaproteobacteria bacterium]|nr:toprim domain-containing protein [Deltaproteobacteria bacterium]
GRKISEEQQGPKYLNSPEAPWFQKSQLFYGFSQGKKAIQEQGKVFLVEGYMDVLRLASVGFTESLAPLGTSLSQAQAKKLKYLHAEVILFFDGDSAGQAAQKKALATLLSQEIFPSYLKLNEQEDPDSFLLEKGRLALEESLKNRRNLLQDLFDKASKNLRETYLKPEEKAQGAQEILKLLKEIPDPLTFKLYCQKLSQILEVPESYFLGTLKAPSTRFKAPKEKIPSPSSREDWPTEERDLIELWLEDVKIRKILREALQIEDFYSKKIRKLLQSFWGLFDQEPQASTDRYLEIVDSEDLGQLSGLALKEKTETSSVSLEQKAHLACLRIKESRLRRELKSLYLDTKEKNALNQRLPEKIAELSQLLEQREKIHAQS